MNPEETNTTNLTRRRDFLARLAALPVALASAGRAGAQEPPITLPTAPFSRAFDFSRLKSWITPTEEFFVRSHFGIPEPGGRPWTLTVTGAVERERVFTLEELLGLPRVEMAATLECAGNLVGWGGVSNARWAGVRLGALLEAAGVGARSVEAVLVGADGGAEREAGGILVDAYARGIAINKALHPDTIIAYEMNGAGLPRIHGGPLRAIVPGWYGMDSVKWLKKVVLAREPFQGFYQSNRYYEARSIGGRVERRGLNPMRVKSQIARPARQEVIKAAAYEITGAAWSGEAEVAEVLLSFDGGRSWQAARLGAERAPFAWRLWSFRWEAAAGRYEIIARARDTAGRQQPLTRDQSIITPYANNWADRRSIEVR